MSPRVGPRPLRDRRWATLAALLLLWLQLAWGALNDLRSIGLRVALVLAAWLAWKRMGGRSSARPARGALDVAAIASAAILAASLFVLFRLDVRPSSRAVALAALTALAACLAPLARRRLRERGWLQPAVVSVGAVLVAIALAGPSLHAQWGAADDHEIMAFLGDDGRVGLAEIPTLLAGTEVGRPGQALRYRPVYYTLRLLESAWWGDAPARWYAARIAMLAVSLALAGLVLARAIGLLPAALFVLYMLTLRFWSDIWCRLGPGETYAALGSALYVFGLQGIWRSDAGGRTRDWLLLLAGSLLAIGSKENFLLLTLPTVGLLAAVWVRRRPRAIALATTAASLIFAGFVAACVGLAVSRAGGDVYGASVTPESRLLLVREGATRFFAGFSPWDLAAGLALLDLALHGLADSRTRSRAVRVLIRGTLAVLAMAFLYATQYAFYLGRQQTGMRYDFPGALATPLALLAVAVTMLSLLHALGFDRRVLRGVHAGLVAGLALAVSFRDPLIFRQGCLANAKVTAAFTTRLEEVAARLREHPEIPLIVTAEGAQSYERVRGLPRFLTRQGVRNVLVLRFEAPTAEPRAFERTLAAEMLSLSRAGGDGYAAPPDPSPAACFGLGIGREPAPPCASLGTLPR